jgi:hypothetical protein
LFDGLTESELEGLEVVKNLLLWGNKDGTPPPALSKWETGGMVSAHPGAATAETEKTPAVPNRKGSWAERISAGFGIGSPGSNDERDQEKAERERERLREVAERAARLPIAGKRMHDALEEVAKLRNKHLWRAHEGPLQNLHQTLLVICGFFVPEGLSVLDGSFEKSYEKGISRLSLRQQEWMDQSDTELHHDRACKESIRTREVFGLLL